MIDLAAIAGAALLAGFLGSAHCFGMCGGISGLFAANASASSLRSDTPKAIAYNVGRILTYTVFGVLIATLGAAFVDAIPELAGPVRLVGGVLIILVGLQVAFRWRLLAPIENLGAKLWSRVAPSGSRMFPITTLSGAVRLGLLWGFLPCGLVYSALLIAASTADPLRGGLVMLMFGVGTMPAMLATGLSAARVASFASKNHLMAGLVIVLLGLATLILPIQSLFSTTHHVH